MRTRPRTLKQIKELKQFTAGHYIRLCLNFRGDIVFHTFEVIGKPFKHRDPDSVLDGYWKFLERFATGSGKTIEGFCNDAGVSQERTDVVLVRFNSKNQAFLQDLVDRGPIAVYEFINGVHLDAFERASVIRGWKHADEWDQELNEGTDSLFNEEFEQEMETDQVSAEAQ